MSDIRKTYLAVDNKNGEIVEYILPDGCSWKPFCVIDKSEFERLTAELAKAKEAIRVSFGLETDEQTREWIDDVLKEPQMAKIKFPPLTSGSKIDLDFLSTMIKNPEGSVDNDLQLFSRIELMKMICALAAAEWEDVACFMKSGSAPEDWNHQMWVAIRHKNDWNAFRREHCK